MGLSPRLSPRLAYGRHRGPASADAKHAAVLVAIYRDPPHGSPAPHQTTVNHPPLNPNQTSVVDRDPLGPWSRHRVVMIVRTRDGSPHSGQVAFPGGRCESGETPEQTAIREFTEETGCRPVVKATFAELPPVWVYASGYLMHPVVVAIESPGGRYRPQASEVQRIIEPTIGELTQRQNLIRHTVRRPRDGSSDHADSVAITFGTQAIRYRNDIIWGATALVWAQTLRLLLRRRPMEITG